jgi:plasmid stability protein
MATITVKNIPDDVYERLKQSARANRRSINSEIIVCIERAVSPHVIDPDEMIARARLLREKTTRYRISDEAFNAAKVAGRE